MLDAWQDPEVQARMAQRRPRGPGGGGWHHTPEARARISASKRGRPNVGHRSSPRSLECRVKIAEAAARNHAAGIYFKGPTKLELALRELLQTASLEFEEQKRFGRYVVDAFVPSHGLVFEADGIFWYHHQDKEREARRDAYLVNRGVAAVVHLTEEDLL